MSGQHTGPTTEDSGSARLLIAGLGNPMMGNDGVGHAVVERLRLSQAPRGVRVEALAGDVLGLAGLWAGEPHIWLVDAISGGFPPGSLQVVEHCDLLALPGESCSTHHPSLSESLRWLLHGTAEMAAINFRLYGVEAGSVRPRVGLSPDVEEAVGRLVETLWMAASA